MITMGIKKACGNEAIGDNVRPDGLITIFLLALAKVRRIFGTAKKKGKKFAGSLKKVAKRCCRA